MCSLLPPGGREQAGALLRGLTVETERQDLVGFNNKDDDYLKWLPLTLLSQKLESLELSRVFSAAKLWHRNSCGWAADGDLGVSRGCV